MGRLGCHGDPVNNADPMGLDDDPDAKPKQRMKIEGHWLWGPHAVPMTAAEIAAEDNQKHFTITEIVGDVAKHNTAGLKVQATSLVVAPSIVGAPIALTAAVRAAPAVVVAATRIVPIVTAAATAVQQRWNQFYNKWEAPIEYGKTAYQMAGGPGSEGLDYVTHAANANNPGRSGTSKGQLNTRDDREEFDNSAVFMKGTPAAKTPTKVPSGNGPLSSAKAEAQKVISQDPDYGRYSTQDEPYSHLPEVGKVEPGRRYSSTQRSAILDENEAQNGGKLVSESGVDIPDRSRAHIDHHLARSKGGENSNANARVLLDTENLKKGAD